jgi:hypothetical protein
VPVDRVDDPDSKVDIVATASADLRGVARPLGGLATGRIPVDRVRAAPGARSRPERPRRDRPDRAALLSPPEGSAEVTARESPDQTGTPSP